MSLKSEVMNINNGYIMEQMKIYDYDEIITLWRTELSEQSLSISDEKEYLAIMIEHNPNLCWVVKKNNHIIGTILGGWDGRRGYIHHLVVSKKYQGQKIGSILMSKVLSKFKEMKIPKCHLFVQKDNEKAISIYLHKGFFKRDELVMMTKII